MGGTVAEFVFVDINDVVLVPSAVQGKITADIELAAGKAWFSGTGVIYGNIFTELQQPGGNKPDFWKVSFKGKIPEWNNLTADLFSIMVHYRFMVLVTDMNGMEWVLGHPDYEGLEFSSDGSTGNGGSGFNGHEFEFYGIMPYKAPNYKGTYTIDAGDCPPASVTADGTTVELLAGSTNTLAEVIADFTDAELLDALQTTGQDAALEVNVTATSGTILTIPIDTTVTLEDVIDGATVVDIGDAVVADGRAGLVFEELALSVTNQEVEDALSATQRKALISIPPPKIGHPVVIYSANDIGTNNPGRLVDFFTLAVNNPNGNTNRFENIGANVLIDWATGLYWTRALQATNTWAGHNTAAAALTLDGLTGWRLPHESEYYSILNRYSATPLNHSGFGITLGVSTNFWTGVVNPGNTAQAYVMNITTAGTVIMSFSGRGNSNGTFYCKSI